MSSQPQRPGTGESADPTTELVNKLLKLPDEAKLELARLLTESVREGFNSLEEGEKMHRDVIHSRLQQLVSGEVELLDSNEALTNLKTRLPPK